MDLKDTEAAGGIIALLLTAWQFLWSRSDRAEKRVGDIAVQRVEESEKFVLVASQKVLNDQLQRDIAEVKEGLEKINAKLDAIFFGGRFPTRKDD